MKVSYSKILQRPNYLIVLIFFRKQKGARMRRKSAVQEVSCHKELQGNLWGNWKLGDLGGAVGVAGLVCEIHTHFLKYMRWDLAKVNLRKRCPM